ncbi:unnamed protein product, partial [marine sediment metagenome]
LEGGIKGSLLTTSYAIALTLAGFEHQGFLLPA